LAEYLKCLNIENIKKISEIEVKTLDQDNMTQVEEFVKKCPTSE